MYTQKESAAKNAALRFEIREFDGSVFGEGYEISYGENVEDFESFVEQFTDSLENEEARPFNGIVAGRQWTNSEGQQISAFAYRNHESQ